MLCSLATCFESVNTEAFPFCKISAVGGCVAAAAAQVQRHSVCLHDVRKKKKNQRPVSQLETVLLKEVWSCSFG